MEAPVLLGKRPSKKKGRGKKRGSKKATHKKGTRKGKRAMSPKQKKAVERLKKAGSHCRKSHEPFSKSFGKCMKSWFKSH